MQVDRRLAAIALGGARKGADGWYRAACPFCLEITGKEDRRQSLGIKPSIMFFVCFKCDARGRLHEDDIGAEDWAPEIIKTDELPPNLGPPDSYEPLWIDDSWNSISLEDPRSYMVGRGVSRLTIKEARIGVCTEGFYADRIIVPTLDLDGRTWLGFVARDWSNKAELRYRYPRGMPRAKFLYNQAALYKKTDDPVMIVEGVFDALPYWPDVIACLGKPGDVHRRLMTEATRPVVVCLDGDAHTEGWALAEYLKLYGCRVAAIRLPPMEDPNSVDKDWLREEVRKADY